MALRWYTIVVDCLDVKAQAEWWRDSLLGTDRPRHKITLASRGGATAVG